MDSDEGRGDDVYQPDGAEVQDDEGLLDSEDTLEREADPEDRGYSPPEKPSPATRYGLTGREQEEGASLDELLSEEQPDGTPPEDEEEGIFESGGENTDDEVGGPRAGRLVSPDEGIHGDEEKDLVAQDVGVDSAAATAEEAAVHLVDEDTYEDWSESDERF